ncbi:heparan-alpha-glucosaminide N-acetyltransferase domain-containing protein [Marinibactrum halimedae]|uniref:Heparan-alpha-glucosaminide N-acetyltransferase catalytic domain-containing protein n=1 Tax=Marinibactrum halimedae TaxID=1444977 RepID=A0AA37WMM7_9GAMM|nr:heparan-alpha-glucosaminide N-acetyltransferase domain-containing protein [Marinibactrum halimedae]MCD9458594.1 DUF1624 domain-containing protein [Marinibactrum halimedae]GLS26538.1 hypothetical protein GCM10007877_22540 [Marinibactrum halimedae]
MNSGHQRCITIDIIRGIGALLLVVIHSLWMYGADTVQFESSFGVVIHAIGQGTSAFLITMGFSFAVTPHQGFGYGLKRALMILAMGYLMNALKFIVPIEVFGTMPESFINAYGWQSPLSGNQLLYLLLTGDILQMAGISFLLLALIRHWCHNRFAILGLVIVFIAIGPLLRGARLGIPGVDYVLDLLWGDQWNVYFPVLFWMPAILIGSYLGMTYKKYHLTDPQILKQMLVLGLPCFVIGSGLKYFDIGTFNDFFHPGPADIVYSLGVCLCSFSVVCFSVLSLIKINRRVYPVIQYLSQRTTSIYIIQWTLVCWGMGVIGYKTLNIPQLIALMPIMIVLTLLIDYLVMKFIRVLKNGLFARRVALENT